jgi:hypothetical protein
LSAGWWQALLRGTPASGPERRPSVNPVAELRQVDDDSAAVVSWHTPAPPDSAAPEDAAGRDLISGRDVILFLKPDSGLRQTLERHGARSCTWIDPRPRQPPHAAAHFLGAAGCAVPDDLCQTPIWPDNGRAGTALWLHPGSGSPGKNWPLSFFVDLAVACQKNDGKDIWVSFGEADLPLVAPFRREMASAGVHYRELFCPPLGELRNALVSHAAMYVGNDSGVSHLAGALDIPTVVLFRSTDPRLWRPVGRCRVYTENDGVKTGASLWCELRQAAGGDGRC